MCLLQAHYSSEKAATWLGIGTDNVVKIKSDSRYRMTFCPLIVGGVVHNWQSEFREQSHGQLGTYHSLACCGA